MKNIVSTIKEKHWVLADQLVVSGAGFISSLLLARGLGITTFGKFSGIVMIQLFLLSVSMAMGAQVYQVVYHSLPPANQQKITRGMIGQQLVSGLVVILLGLLLLLFIPSLANNLGLHNTFTMLLPGITIALLNWQDFLRRLLLAQYKAAHALVVDAVSNILQVIALVVTWYYNLLTLPLALCIIGFTSAPAIIIGYLLLKAGKPSIADITFTWQSQKHKAPWLAGSSLLQWGAGYFFVAAAGWWVGAAALGALRLAQYIYGLLNVLLQAIENYTLPRATTTTDIKKYWLQLLKKCLLLVLPLLVMLAVFAGPVLRLAGGSSYQQYTFIMYGLSAVYLLVTIGYPVRIAIRAQHMDKEYFIAYILSVTASIVIAPWLLHNWQLYGVLAGLFLTQLICISYWLIILQYKKSFLWK